MKQIYLILLVSVISFTSRSQVTITWHNPLPQGNTLFGVTSVDETTAVAVGAGGIILQTVNGGTTWNFQPSGTTEWLYSVNFANSFVGWVFGAGGAGTFGSVSRPEFKGIKTPSAARSSSIAAVRITP